MAVLPAETNFQIAPLTAHSRAAGFVAPLYSVLENLLFVGGPAHTLSADDHGKTLVFAAGQACTLTVPAGLPQLQKTDILQWDASSPVTLSAGGGVNLVAISGHTATTGKGSMLRMIAVFGDDWAVLDLSGAPLALIETKTVSAAGEVAFTSLGNGDNLLLRCSGMIQSADTGLALQIGQGGGPTYDATKAHYDWAVHYSAGSASGAAGADSRNADSGAIGSVPGMPIGWAHYFSAGSGAAHGSAEVKIFSAQSSTITKNFQFQSWGWFNEFPGNLHVIGGGSYADNSDPLTALRLIPGSGTITGKFSLYSLAD